MRSPCTRDCPDRKPGCECEKRRAWKWQQDQAKEARRRDSIVDNYVTEMIRSVKKTSRNR